MSRELRTPRQDTTRLRDEARAVARSGADSPGSRSSVHRSGSRNPRFKHGRFGAAGTYFDRHFLPVGVVHGGVPHETLLPWRKEIRYVFKTSPSGAS